MGACLYRPVRGLAREQANAKLAVVPEVRRQPALTNTHILPFARAVALDLVLVHLAHGKVLRLRVSEVPAADRRCREHSEVLGEEHATRPGLANGSAIEQAEQGFLSVWSGQAG